MLECALCVRTVRRLRTIVPRTDQEGFKRTRFLRFDRTKDGLCRKCYDAPRNKVPAGAKRKAGQAVQEARQRAMSVPRLVQGTVLLPCYISVTLNDLDSTKLGDLEYISSRLDAQSIRKAICNVEEIAKHMEQQVTDVQLKVTQRGDGNDFFRGGGVKDRLRTRA